MLWDVTDKNTDFVTLEILKAMLSISGSSDPLQTDVALLVARVRKECPCIITGAALVVYGLPLHLINFSLEVVKDIPCSPSKWSLYLFNTVPYQVI